jgi:SAM-dependent methyltransferase
MAAEILSRRRALVLSLPLLLCAPLVRAQSAQSTNAAAAPPEPVFGTPGKDAGWIPTPGTMVDAMLKMARVGPSDLVADLGSGDGRIPILAAQTFGSRGLGIELNADLVRYSEQEARKQGVAGRVKFVRGDIFETDFSQASVVTLFMPPSVLRRLRPKLLAMKAGTRIVSYLFAMDEWEPDEWAHSDSAHGMLWIVPAAAGGTWRIEAGGPSADTYGVRIEQRFQRIGGKFLYGSAELPLFDARLDGDRLRFTALVGERRFDFTAAVNGDALEGRLHVTGEPARTFRATRA